MATKKDQPQEAYEQVVRQPEQDAPKQEAAAQPLPVIHRTTVPVAPTGLADAVNDSIVSRIRATLQQVAYSRDPEAAAHAQLVLAQQVLPTQARPEVRQYLAEANDYLLGKIAQA